jgi:hypothetical protein
MSVRVATGPLAGLMVYSEDASRLVELAQHILVPVPAISQG